MSKTVISEVQQMWQKHITLHASAVFETAQDFQPFFQAEQEVLARMEVDVQAARLLTWKVSFLPGFKSSLEDGENQV